MSSGINPFDELDWSDVGQLIDELEGEDAAVPDADRGHDMFDYLPVSGAAREPGDEARWHLRPDRSTQQPAAGDDLGPSTQASKKARLKEKNRQAQARYRQRKLVRSCTLVYALVHCAHSQQPETHVTPPHSPPLDVTIATMMSLVSFCLHGDSSGACRAVETLTSAPAV